MRDQDIFNAFRAVVCAACKRGKRKHTAFCPDCYFSLPAELKSAIWHKFGNGFEAAYVTAKEWLTQ